jgi:hypothetical protein
MSGFIVTGKGRLTRNPMTVTAADAEFAKICLMNADMFYVEMWLHAAGKLGTLISESLTAGTEVSVKAEIHPKAGKLRYLRSPGEHVFLIT